MTFTIDDLRRAFQAGSERGAFDANHNYFDAPLDEDEYIESITNVEKIVIQTIPVTYSLIKITVGWSRFCDVTGYNHYTINEFGDFDDNHKFNITLPEWNELFKGLDF